MTSSVETYTIYWWDRLLQLSGRFESSILEMVLNIGGKYCGVYFGMSQEIMFLAWNLFSDIIRPPIWQKLGFPLCVWNNFLDGCRFLNLKKKKMEFCCMCRRKIQENQSVDSSPAEQYGGYDFKFDFPELSPTLSR